MPTLEGLGFEIERRVIIFHRDTTMPDDTQLGYTGDPNNVINGNTPGETLLYNSPSGTKYIDKGANPHVGYTKTQDTAGGTWVEDAGVAEGGGELFEAEVFTLDATDITNKYVQLTYVPADNSEISLLIGSAPVQEYGTDFKQDDTFSKRITWELLGLDGILEIGDIITINYTR